MTKILCAPLQGYTDSAWRTAHSAVFGGIDAYYSPFLRVFHGAIKGLADVSPERNAGISLVPQVLAGRPEETVRIVEELKKAGYRRIDINMVQVCCSTSRRLRLCAARWLPCQVWNIA